MELFGKGISGTVKKSLHSTVAQRSFTKNFVKSSKPFSEKSKIELREFYKFKGLYFSKFANFMPWLSLGCFAKMCPDFHKRSNWFKVLQERFNLSDQLTALPPAVELDRSEIAYVSAVYKSRTAKLTFRNCYNNRFTSKLNVYGYLQQESEKAQIWKQHLTADRNGSYVIRLPFDFQMESADSFFLGFGVPTENDTVCKLLFTFGKVLQPILSLRSFSDVNFLFQI